MNYFCHGFMKNALLYTQKAIVFRQWSRKNYAVFTSLRKEVNIGHVDIDTCDKALGKDKKKRDAILRSKELFYNDSDELDDQLEVFQDELTSFVFSLNKEESSRHSRKKISKHILLIIRLSCYQDMDLYCIKTSNNERSI